ncbi:MAG: YqjD family protein [Limisphaerales bacterium]
METEFSNIRDAASDLARTRLADDVRILIHDAERLLEATAGDVSEKAKDLRARLRDAVDRAKLSAADLQAQARAGARKVDEVVRAHPYESMGVAFGVGVLLGVLLNRR